MECVKLMLCGEKLLHLDIGIVTHRINTPVRIVGS